MKSRAAKFNYVRWFFVLLGIIFIYNIFQMPEKYKHAVHRQKVTDIYTEIFPKKAFAEIKPVRTYFNNFADPVATFSIGGNTDRLIVHELKGLDGGCALKDVIDLKIQPDSDLIQFGYANIPVMNDLFKFAVTWTDKLPWPPKLRVDVDGELESKPVISDSILHYSFQLDKLQAAYAGNDTAAYMAESKKLFTKIPVQVLFLKKDKKVYLLMMYPLLNITQPRESDYLLKLVQGTS